MFQLHKIEPVFSITHLVNVSYYAIPSSFIWDGESHDFWEFVYVDKGEVLVEADKMTYLLKAGEMAFHRPNEYHRVSLYGDSPASILVIAFQCTSPAMENFSRKILFLGQQEKKCITEIVKEAENTYRYFDNLPPVVDLAKVDEPAVGSEQIIQTTLEQLFIYILRRNENIRFEARRVPKTHQHHHEVTVALVKQYLNEHLKEKISLDDISAHFNISSSQLKRIFKSYAGTTVISYLISLRIAEAKRLIREDELTFSQIAEQVGYDNIYYFSSQFKIQTGMTPTEYCRSVHP